MELGCQVQGVVNSHRYKRTSQAQLSWAVFGTKTCLIRGWQCLAIPAVDVPSVRGLPGDPSPQGTGTGKTDSPGFALVTDYLT